MKVGKSFMGHYPEKTLADRSTLKVETKLWFVWTYE